MVLTGCCLPTKLVGNVSWFVACRKFSTGRGVVVDWYNSMLSASRSLSVSSGSDLTSESEDSDEAPLCLRLCDDLRRPSTVIKLFSPS